MPTYQYVCTACGHAFDQVQSFSDDALTTALEVAADIAKLAPLSVQGHKHALNLVATAVLDDRTVAEIGALEAAAFSSADLQEGLAAFGEKRAPRFEGR